MKNIMKNNQKYLSVQKRSWDCPEEAHRKCHDRKLVLCELLLRTLDELDNMNQLTNFFFVFYPFPNAENTINYYSQECIESHTNISEQYNQFSSHDNENFWKLFEKEVTFMNEKFGKKVWSTEEDLELIRLREEGHTWRSIARIIDSGKDQICKRRYEKLKLEQKKWPKEIDIVVKNLYEVEKLSWPKIFAHLRSKFNLIRKKKLQNIRTRYRLHLSSRICKEQWNFFEDCILLDFVNKNGNKWRDLSLIFQNRTELQLKNRYYGTLKPIELKVLEKMKKLENVCLQQTNESVSNL